MINTRPDTLFLRKELAVTIALVLSSFGGTGITVADTTDVNPLPTLVDPAGILDPELLSTLNDLFNTSDDTSKSAGAVKTDTLSARRIQSNTEQAQVSAVDVNEPKMAAALSTQSESNLDDVPTDSLPSLIDPSSVLKESGFLLESEVKESVGDNADSANSIASLKKVGSKTLRENESLIEPESHASSVSEAEPTNEQLLTLRFTDMLALALVDNPNIVMAAERINQAIEQSNQIGAYRYPEIALTSTLGPEYNDPVPSEESGVATTIGKNVKLTLTHQLYDGGSARSNFNRSQRLVGAAEAESQIELESLLLDIVVNYVDYWRYQVELVQAEGFVSVMNDLVGDLDSMYNAGAISKLEVDFARARVASARGAETEAAASMNNAFSELEYLVPGLAKFSANSPEEFTDFSLLSLQEYLDNGASANSGFLTNKMNTEATELKVLSAKGLSKPTVNVELSGSYIDDEGQPSDRRLKAAAKFLLNYTFYNGGERRATVRRAESQLREFQAERVLLEREVFREIDQSFNNITASRLALDAVVDEIIAHEELQRLNRQNLALGTVKILELIDVEERLFNANSRKNEVMATMYQEYFTLLISAGFTEEILAKYELELASNAEN